MYIVIDTTWFCVYLFFKIAFYSIIAAAHLFMFALKITLYFLKGIWILIKWICKMIVFAITCFKRRKND